MKFWAGNRRDAEFEMSTDQVAEKFAAWWHEQPADERGFNMERELRFWLTSPEFFNSVWVDEFGEESFTVLLSKVIGLIYGTRDAPADT